MASQTLQTIRNGWAPEIKRLNDNLEKLEASLSDTTTPARIRTPPGPVSGFVTVTTPTRICTPPAPVSGIQQHTLIV